MNYSVLMSVYYREKSEFLYEAMQSIAQQTIPTNDFVLVCDGPLTESLEEVIDGMQNVFGEVLNVVRLFENKGLGNALNEGLKYCKNDLVARMDSDDIAHSDRCEKQLEAYIKIPDMGILSSGVLEFSDTPYIITGKRNVPRTNAEIVAYSRRRNPMNHPVVMFRKSKVQEVGGYSERFHLFEDYYLWVRMLRQGIKAHNLSEYLLSMRTPTDMFKRRGGLRYAKNMIEFRWWMYASGWSSLIDFMVSAIPQMIICILPNKLRKDFYRILHTCQSGSKILIGDDAKWKKSGT